MTRRLVPSRAAVLASAALILGCGPAYPPPPETARVPVHDTIHGVAFVDQYRWLEDQDSPDTRAWIAAQNAYAERIVGDTPMRRALEDRLAALIDVSGPVHPRRAGEHEYFSLRKKGREVAAIYRRPAPDEPDDRPLDADADYEVVIDPLEWDPSGTTRAAIRDFSPDGSLMLYSVRDGGPDEVEIRLRDVVAGRDLPDRLPEALYGNVFFDDEGAGFYYVHRSRTEGPRFRYHVLEAPPSADVELFGEGVGPESFLSVSRAGDRFVYAVQHGWARSDVYVHDPSAGTPPVAVVTGAPARFRPRFVDGELFLLTNLDAPNNRVVAADLDDPESDPSNWREVLPEASDVLVNYHVADGSLYAEYLRDVSTRIARFDMDGAPTGEIAVPPGHAASLRLRSDGSALLSLSSLTAPARVLEVDLETLEADEWMAPQAPFDGADFELTQVWYASKDGTRAPMYVAHRRGLELAGDAPALLYGYGGFNVSLLPRFDARAAAWMERGGVYAMATLRGGGEFGEEWHRAGMLENKPNVFDDFVAAAEWLIASGYTNPNRLAIRGASNGGLLVAAAATRRPELFRAVYCGFPDLDMIRFHRFTTTNNLPALLEYGNAAVPGEFEVLRTFSPYQQVRNGVDYPAVMLAQGDLDTRVPPLQARKMTARLQAASASGLPIILDYDPRAGHAGGRAFSRNVRNAAMELAFLMGQVGLVPQS